MLKLDDTRSKRNVAEEWCVSNATVDYVSKENGSAVTNIQKHNRYFLRSMLKAWSFVKS